MQSARRLSWLIGLAVILAGCSTISQTDSQSRLTIISINDVYRVSGINNGQRGGLARVRTLRKQYEDKGHPVLLLHAGDFLFPSLLSRRTDGQHMISVMNHLDGEAERFDSNMVVTFGNHEFERSKRKGWALLQSRISDSQFHWLKTNIQFEKDQNGVSLITHPNLKDDILYTFGDLRVGLFSLTTDERHPAYVTTFSDPVETARVSVKALRQKGADAVIGLTHLKMSEDEKVLETLGSEGPDLIIGGHEHRKQIKEVSGRKIIKADADALSAAIIDVTRSPSGNIDIRTKFASLDHSITPDPDVAQVADDWAQAFHQDYCESLRATSGCLNKAVGKTQVELVGEELEFRRYETNLGNWIADQALEAFKPEGAQLAFINAGGLRLNQNIPAGASITEQHLETLFAFPSKISLIQIDGTTLKAILERSIEGWTGNGWWLQVAGIRFRANPESGTVRDLKLLRSEGEQVIKPDDTFLAVTADYLLNPATGQDGYVMIGPSNRVTEEGVGPDLRDVVYGALRKAGEDGIAPRMEGRICLEQRFGLTSCNRINLKSFQFLKKWFQP